MICLKMLSAETKFNNFDYLLVIFIYTSHVNYHLSLYCVWLDIFGMPKLYGSRLWPNANIIKIVRAETFYHVFRKTLEKLLSVSTKWDEVYKLHERQPQRKKPFFARSHRIETHQIVVDGYRVHSFSCAGAPTRL